MQILYIVFCFVLVFFFHLIFCFLGRVGFILDEGKKKQNKKNNKFFYAPQQVISYNLRYFWLISIPLGTISFWSRADNRETKGVFTYSKIKCSKFGSTALHLYKY